MDPKYAKAYERLYREHWWWRAREQYLVKLLDILEFPRSGTILDVGCGGGWSFDAFGQYGQMFGVELDANLVSLAGEHVKQIHCGPFDLSYQPDRKFSLILMLDVLEHLEDPQAALAHSLRLLEPDGKILITVPAFKILWTSHDDLNHHCVRYTKTSLQRLANQTDFQIQYMRYFFHWVTPVKLFYRFKESVFRTPPASPTIPGRRLNEFFIAISNLEQRILGRVAVPFGTSLVCVGSLPKHA
jgi:SAM-dependent methyltransferase